MWVCVTSFWGQHGRTDEVTAVVVVATLLLLQ